MVRVLLNGNVNGIAQYRYNDCDNISTIEHYQKYRLLDARISIDIFIAINLYSTLVNIEIYISFVIESTLSLENNSTASVKLSTPLFPIIKAVKLISQQSSKSWRILDHSFE